ncbi:MAG: hypothetical protein AB1806_11950 [Acidobacteriota bacterium]
MGTINTGKVIVGGLVAGVVINISEFILYMAVLGRDMEAAITRMNLSPIGGMANATFVVSGFVLGIAVIWLYAAIRPRFGPGPRTALCAGAAVWLFAYLYPTVGMVAMGMFSAGSMAVALVWGLVELLVAAAAGAALYKE